ncbi:MAG TPA: glycosyl hydrolase family 32, partial [Candidatus Hydrogenedentes bacterium]|nr:glycosyl hydrolase family 32 [Candidatus Hydrogenedentota bacterium]
AGEAGGLLLTRPVRFSGKRLFVNAKTDGGELRAEVCDVSGVPQPGFTKDECLPVAADSTCGEVAWTSGGDLAAFAGKPVRFRFHLKQGSLYAFWVSPDESGASHGFVAAGGPGFMGPTDTVGRAGQAR